MDPAPNSPTLFISEKLRAILQSDKARVFREQHGDTGLVVFDELIKHLPSAPRRHFALTPRY